MVFCENAAFNILFFLFQGVLHAARGSPSEGNIADARRIGDCCRRLLSVWLMFFCNKLNNILFLLKMSRALR